jgi:putative ABC transport system substrate-binding protein
MRRREFIVGLGTAAMWPLAVRARQPSMPVVGFLHSVSPAPFARMVAGFQRGLREAGYVEGQNVTVAYRWAEGQNERLPALAADLVGRHVAVIAATGGLVVARAAKAATSSIPIVFVSGADPVQAGLVASLNRPGGNITGVSPLFSGLGSKRLELLHLLVPKAAVIGVLVNPNYDADLQVQEVQTAAVALGLKLDIVRASTETEIDKALTTLVKQGVDALFVANDPFFDSHRDQIIGVAARDAIPAMYYTREYAAAGGLISYGSNIVDAYRQAGIYTGKILAGTKPADLPVMQPTKFELVINLMTAKGLGLQIPPTLLALADEVIE